jgi:putative RecB family exonuclease
MVAALSPSSMATWRQCPRRFFYEKILRLETDTGEPAVCGSFVHLVLERLLQCPPEERTPERARALAAEVWPGFIADPESRFVELDLDAEQSKAFKRRAWAGVTGYFRIEDPRAVEVVCCEEAVSAELDGAPVYGIIDRVDRGPDGLVVTDYKSGKAPVWDDEREEKLGQLRTYAALLEANGKRVSDLRLLFVSPQLSAAARLERCEAREAEAITAVLASTPVTPDDLGAALAEIDLAQRLVREGKGTRQASAEAVAARAAELAAGWGDGAAELLVAAFDARRRAFFARRTLAKTVPTTVHLRVTEDDLAQARSEAATIWADASACYDAWDFPGRTGALCDWCPFAERCETFQAWEAAGRPALLDA